MRIIRFILFLSCCHLFLSSSKAQTFEHFNISVIINGDELLNPWAGGMNAPQWSYVDLNEDDLPDLYAFDRTGDVHLTFLNVSEAGEAKFEYTPALADGFPECHDFVLLRDYNQDGAMDIFASAFDEFIQGIKVYTGRFENGQLVFDRVLFPQWDNDVITDVTNSYLSVEFDNYPAVDDLDGDGDLDILFGDHFGLRINYYQNMAVESGLTLDTLTYQLTDPCWGKLGMIDFVPNFKLSADSCLCPNFFTQDEASRGHGSSKTLCTFDDDNDGDKEILLGNFSYPNIIYGKNGGTPDEACIESQDTIYPSYDVPVEISQFPATFYLDLDNDGIKDLVASPNLPINSFDYEVAWFYKNIQTNEFPQFELQQKDLFVDGMIDMGTGARPAFVDYNADGLMDLVVGNQSRWKGEFEKEAFLWLFENIGSSTEPKFELVDSNWLNFQLFSEAQLSRSFAPAFGDLDNDGDLDLLVGERYGSLFFVENLAGVGNPMVFGDIQPQWQDINIGSNSTPFIHDINQDGLPDLLIGERTGNVNYFPNQGTSGNPVFHPNPNEAPNNSYFGEVLTQFDLPIGYSAPVVLACEASTYLLTGSELGFLEKYLINPDSLDDGAFEVINETVDSLRIGWSTHLAFADLNNDNFMEAVIGNQRGGLRMFTTDIEVDCTVLSVDIQSAKQLKIFPNPTIDFLSIEFPENTTGEFDMQIFDTQGKVVAQQLFKNGQRIDVGNLTIGLYALKLTDGERVYVGKFIKQ